MTPAEVRATRMHTNIEVSSVVVNADQSEAGNDSEDRFSRRTFCNRLLVTSSGLLLGAAALQSVDAQQAVNAQQLSQVAYPPQRIEGAEKLLPGSSLYFNYPSRTEGAILVRSEAGEYYAFAQKCSHLGCSVYFDRNQSCLACPCHRGKFDKQTGFVIQGPPTKPLDQIVLQMRIGGAVWAVGQSISSGTKYA